MNLIHKKSVQLLNYFAKKEGGKINRMKVIKLIWLADRLHLRNYGRTISKSNDYSALKLGPVSSSILDIAQEPSDDYSRKFIKRVDNYFIESLSNVDITLFSKTDTDVLNTIYEEFGKMREFNLSDFSHLFPEWKRFENDLKKCNTSFSIVMEDFFEDDPTSKIHEVFNQENDLILATKNIYQEHKYISNS